MKLRIAHLDYEVRPLAEDDDCFGEVLGLADHQTQEIMLDADMSPHRQLEVLIHEITHAAWEAYDMPDRADEERVCSFLGRAFATIIRANKQLLPVLEALRNGSGFLGD